MDPSPAHRFLAKVINRRYKIDRLIGHGSFAWVYHAYTRGGQEVAVKVLHSTEPTAGVRFAREIQVLKALPSNPSLVRYVDHGHTSDGWPLLVLEFVDGISLKEGMLRCGALTPGKAVAFLSELCEAFVGLHQLGVAHRDVKPENILLARQGGIKLIDFGLIRDAQGILKLLEQDDPLERRLFDKELDQSILVGTPEYMAPEQFSDATMEDLAQSHTDTWSDVYSLGVILFQLLSGWKPFPMRDVPDREYPREILRYMQWRIDLTDDEMPHCPGIDEALESILSKALRRDPRQRQPDARALMDDLLLYLESGQGVIEADESRTYVVSFEQLIKLQAERDARPAHTAAAATQGGAPSYHRQLPPIGADEDDEETALTSSRAHLIDEDLPNQGHTVIFFAQQGEESGTDPDARSYSSVASPQEHPQYGHELSAYPPASSPGQSEGSPYPQNPAFPGGNDGLGPSSEYTIEEERESARDPGLNPWGELTPTNPRPSGSIEVSQLLVDLDPSIAEVESEELPDRGDWSDYPTDLDIFGTIDAPPPTLDDALDDNAEEVDEVTNKVHISEVEGSPPTHRGEGRDHITRKVNIAEVMPDEVGRRRRKKR